MFQLPTSVVQLRFIIFLQIYAAENKEIDFESLRYQKNDFHVSEILLLNYILYFILHLINPQEHNTRRSFDAEET